MCLSLFGRKKKDKNRTDFFIEAQKQQQELLALSLREQSKIQQVNSMKITEGLTKEVEQLKSFRQEIVDFTREINFSLQNMRQEMMLAVRLSMKNKENDKLNQTQSNIDPASLLRASLKEIIDRENALQTLKQSNKYSQAQSVFNETIGLEIEELKLFRQQLTELAKDVKKSIVRPPPMEQQLEGIKAPAPVEQPAVKADVDERVSDESKNFEKKGELEEVENRIQRKKDLVLDEKKEVFEEVENVNPILNKLPEVIEEIEHDQTTQIPRRSNFETEEAQQENKIEKYQSNVAAKGWRLAQGETQGNEAQSKQIIDQSLISQRQIDNQKTLRLEISGKYNQFSPSVKHLPIPTQISYISVNDQYKEGLFDTEQDEGDVFNFSKSKRGEEEDGSENIPSEVDFNKK